MYVRRYHQVGRSGKLSSRKTTHFQALHNESGIPYNEMLFFDGTSFSLLKQKKNIYFFFQEFILNLFIGLFGTTYIYIYIDCNWQDHCTDVTNTLGVVSMKTPDGLQLDQFYTALQKYHDETTIHQS